MSGLDIFLGDPIYDDQHRVVRREFGVKNVIAIVIVLYVGNLMMGQMKLKSGKRKMSGGAPAQGKLLMRSFVWILVMGVLWIGGIAYDDPYPRGGGWISVALMIVCTGIAFFTI